MISFGLLRFWHYLSLVATVTILLVLARYYGRSFFSDGKGDPPNESG